MTVDLRRRFMDWFPQAVSWKLLAPLTLPIGWQLKTKWQFLFESARMIEEYRKFHLAVSERS